MAPPPGVGAPSPDSLLDNRGPTLIAATSAMSALGLVFVIGRIYCRLISIKRLVVEDYIAILTTVRASMLQAVSISDDGDRH